MHYTHTQTHTHTHILLHYTHTHTQTPTSSHTLSLTHTHTDHHGLSIHTQALRHTYDTVSQTHTHTLHHCFFLTHECTHTYAHPHTHTLSRLHSVCLLFFFIPSAAARPHLAHGFKYASRDTLGYTSAFFFLPCLFGKTLAISDMLTDLLSLLILCLS